MLSDLRYSARLLIRTPGMTAVAILSLALGIGANTTVYSVIHGLMMRAYALEKPAQLMALWEARPDRGLHQADPRVTSALEWRRTNRCFAGLEMLTGGHPITITGPDAPERVQVQQTTPELFSLLGVRPVLGRSYVLPQDSRTVILSHNYWQRRFHGRTDAIGRIVSIEGEAYTVIGVMPSQFQRFFADGDADIWLPIDFSAGPWRERRGNIIVLARLKPGETQAHAEAEMGAIESVIEPGWRVLLKPLPEAMMGIWKPVLYPLFGMVLFVLMIACVNVANLLLARASVRRKEISVRAALGASRGRLVRQLLCDGILLALPGGLLGVLVAGWGIDMWVAFSPPWFPEAREIRLDHAVLLFTAAAAMVSGIFMGLVPAVHGSRLDLNEAIKAASRSSDRSRRRVRGLLVTAEIALTLILTISTGLMIRTFLVLNPADRGFRSENILTMRLDLPEQRYRGASAMEFYRQLLARVSSVPGVESATIATWPPAGDRSAETRFTIPGRAEPQLAKDRPHAYYTAVSPDFFRTFEIPLRRGRGFTMQDTASAPPVVVITEALGRRYFPDQDPLGRFLALGNLPGERARQIIGVAGDIRSMAARPPQPALYIAFPQQTAAMQTRMALALRSAGEPQSLAGHVRAALRQIDGTVPIYDVRLMRDLLTNQPLRFFLWQFAMLAAIAITLSVIGIHGVMSWTVNDRRHEIGIRMALGAGRADLIQMILGASARLAIGGIAIGLIGAWLSCRLLYDFLAGVTSIDPVTYFSVSAILLITAVASAWAPALHAARVDPIASLRAD